MGADEGALAWSAISATSAVIDGSIRLRMKTYDKWDVTPNIWVAIIGPPSSMKTPIINAAWRPLVHAQKHYIDDWKRRLADWKAAPKKERDDDMPVPSVRLSATTRPLKPFRISSPARTGAWATSATNSPVGYANSKNTAATKQARPIALSSFSPSMVDRT